MNYGMIEYTKALPKGAATPYPTRSGWRIYCEASLTSLRRAPVTKLLSYVLSGFAYDEKKTLPFLPRPTCERLIVDGFLAVLNPIGAVKPAVKPTYLDGLFLCEPDRVLQEFLSDRGQPVPGKVVEWGLSGATWTRQVWSGWESEKPKQEGKPEQYAKAALFVQPGELTPFFWSQHTGSRLEEIERDIRKRQRGAASKSVVQVAGGNVDGIISQFEDEDATSVVTGTDTRNFPPASSVVDQLIMEYRELKADYYSALSVVEDDTPDRPSGVDRMQRMRPMLAEISNLRDALKGIYQGFGVAVSFDEIIVLNPAERQAEKALLDELHNTMVGNARALGDDEYLRRLRALA